MWLRGRLALGVPAPWLDLDRPLHELPHLVGDDVGHFVARHVEDELLVRPHSHAREVAVLTIDIAELEAEFLESRLHLFDVAASHAHAQRLVEMGGDERRLGRCDGDRLGRGNGGRRRRRRARRGGLRIVATVAPEPAGNAGDDDRPDHGHGGERRE